MSIVRPRAGLSRLEKSYRAIVLLVALLLCAAINISSAHAVTTLSKVKNQANGNYKFVLSTGDNVKNKIRIHSFSMSESTVSFSVTDESDRIVFSADSGISNICSAVQSNEVKCKYSSFFINAHPEELVISTGDQTDSVTVERYLKRFCHDEEGKLAAFYLPLEVNAGSGSDYISGGCGNDQLLGEQGSDILIAAGDKDDWDILDCGPDIDSYLVDPYVNPSHVTPFSCEQPWLGSGFSAVL